jgi:hypothetical protein
MSHLLPASALAALLVVCAAPRAGAESVEAGGATGADSLAHCTNYSTGSDTHTACAPSASAPPGSASSSPAVACHTYTVGSDTHAVCAPVAAPRLSASRERKAGPAPPPASALRCYTYHIGSSAYTDCR